MREGYLQRTFTAELTRRQTGKAINAKRFCSIVDEEAGSYKIYHHPIKFQMAK